jgi:undecaprenyl-diphosphatase
MTGVSVRALPGWAAAGIAVFLVLAVLVAVGWAPLDTVDIHTVAAVYGWLLGPSRVVTTLGSPLAVDIAAAIAAVAFLLARRVTAAVVIVVARLGELGTETVAKLAIDRARPVFAHPLAVAGGSSFPSGHTAGSAALYGTLVLLCVPLLARRWQVLVTVAAVLFVLAVGLSRVTLGVHYPSDVVGGLALGMAWATGTVAAAAKMSRRAGDRVVPQRR